MVVSNKYSVIAIIGLITVILISASWESKSETKNQWLSIVNQIDSFTKVNDKPHLMMSHVHYLCRIPTEEDYAFERERNPHIDRLINVYVNDVGLSAMTEQKNPKFPVGSIIIKEKFPFGLILDSARNGIELYTVMVKREKGFNPECGDWEFAAVEGDLSSYSSGKIQKCMNCHIGYEKTDFVVREPYLAPRFRKHLK